jgi:hypothetical protein
MKKIFLSLILFLFFTLNVKAVYVEGQEQVEDDGQMHILSEPYEDETYYATDTNEPLASNTEDDKTLLYVGIGGGALVIFAIIGFISTKLEKKNKKEEKIETNNVQ